MMKQKQYGIFYLVMTIIFIGIDRWTKMLAVLYLKNKDAFVIWKNVFELYYLENTGAAFGMLKNKHIIFILITVAVTAAICYMFFKIPGGKHFRFVRVAYSLIVAGAIGNTIDRIVNRYVVDFLYFKLINFPVFNVADCYVCIAAVGLVLLCIFYYREDELEIIFPFFKEKKKQGE